MERLEHEKECLDYLISGGRGSASKWVKTKPKRK